MGITLREWSQQWLEVYVKPVAKPSGYEHYYDNLHKHILPKLGDMPLKSLTTAVVQHFFNEESLHGNLRTGGALSAKSIKNMRVDWMFAVSVLLRTALWLQIRLLRPYIRIAARRSTIL